MRELIERLVTGEVRFVLVGGMAVVAWGHLRATRDLDIVPDPDPENLSRLIDVLEQLGGKVKVREQLLSTDAIRTFVRTGDKALVETELGDVDVLQGLPQVPRFADLAPGAIEVDMDGIPVQVCSLDDLLAMKRAANRALDRTDIDALGRANSEPGEEEKG